MKSILLLALATLATTTQDFNQLYITLNLKSKNFPDDKIFELEMIDN